MIEAYLLQVSREAMMMVLIISGIPLAVSMVVGLLISLVQATTQIQEQTLTFVPKLLTVMGVLALLGYWMMAMMIRFSVSLFESIPRYVV